MLEKIFVSILNMSLMASYVLLFVLLARLFLKKAPKIFSYALWGVVFFRLVCPVSFESKVSFVPSASPIITVPPSDSAVLVAEEVVQEYVVNQSASISTSDMLTIIWLVGIAALAIYSVVSLVMLRYKLIGAVKQNDNIYLVDRLESPFVLGMICPKIYLPSTLSPDEQSYIILHEQTHIKRFDHIVKILAFCTLCVHWFNPLVWLAFVLCVKDMEMSCDESVMKQMGTDIRKEYSASLLGLATGKKMITGAPLAFGEGDMKGRIKNVMNYKKPALWIVVVAVLAVVVVGIGLMANPVGNNTPLSNPDNKADFSNFKPYDTFSFSELAPTQTEMYKETLTFSSDSTKLTYVATWTPSGLSADIGLISQDGTEYLVGAVGGSAKGSIKDIPAGTYQVVLLNSESNKEHGNMAENLNITGSMAFTFNSVSEDATPVDQTNNTASSKQTQEVIVYEGFSQADKSKAINQQLQDRLQAVINGIEIIESSTVKISDDKSSVAVELKLVDNMNLSDEQKSAITGLVKNSVGDVSEENIKISTVE